MNNQNNIGLNKNNLNYGNLLSRVESFINKEFSGFKEIEAIILFGSAAKGTYKSGSDIDLCVILDKNAKRISEIKIHEYFLDLSKDLDINIEVLYIYINNLKNWDPILIQNLIKEGILLFGKTDYEIPFKNYIEKNLYVSG